MNWEGEILITEEKKGKEGKDFFVGRNFAYKKVYIEKRKSKEKKGNEILGKFLNCKIINAGEILEGEILE